VKFGQLTIVVNRSYILRLKCYEVDFVWVSDPVGGAYSAPPDPLAGFKGTYFSGEGKEGSEGRGREGDVQFFP